MGYYLGSHRVGLMGTLGPILTPREYLSVLAQAARCVIQSPERLPVECQRGMAHLAGGRTSAALSAFSTVLRRLPRDPTVHRMVGIAHLSAGHVGAGLGHLALALEIRRHETRASVSLYEALCTQLELALLRLVLLPLYARAGQRDAVKRLTVESLLIL